MFHLWNRETVINRQVNEHFCTKRLIDMNEYKKILTLLIKKRINSEIYEKKLFQTWNKWGYCIIFNGMVNID